MEIVYLGHSSFRLSNANTSVVTDPFDPQMVGLKFPKVTASVVTVSHDHQDHNRSDLVEGVKQVLYGPGEYEIEDTSYIGVASFHDNSQGSERGPNVIFIIEMDGLRLAHLGDLGHKLSEATQSAIGSIDILFIPVGGFFTIGAQEAAEVVRMIEPQIIIPMHFQAPSLNQTNFAKLEPPDPFIKNLGLKVERLPKLKAKEGTIPADDQVIVLLEQK